jgi:hypothetical protein
MAQSRPKILIRPHVRSGSIASVWPDHGDFRSTPVNGHSQDRRACLKGAKGGHRTILAGNSAVRVERPIP